MKWWNLVAIISVPFITNANGLDKNKKNLGEKSLSKLEDELRSEKSPLDAFYYQNEIVRRFSSNKTLIEKTNVLRAKQVAQSVLENAKNFKDNWDYGNAIHHGHAVLGRVALFDGQLDKALQELKLAADTPGSPQLNSFGPNMTLALELLKSGNKVAVLEYFDHCSRFWNNDIAKASIADWKQDIAHEQIPKFKGNLDY